MNKSLNMFSILFMLITGFSSTIGISTKVQAQSATPDIQLSHPLATAQVLLVESLALTERGLQDSSAITQTVTAKLEEAGFTVTTDPDQPHDAIVRVKCEERKTWTGPSQYRSTSPALTARLWKGPACLITYRHGEPTHQWNWEIRTKFEDAQTAAQEAQASSVGDFAMKALIAQLQEDEFPLFLAAEWEQVDRLLMILAHSTNNVERQKTVLQLLGPLPSEQAFNALQEALNTPALSATALSALGYQGEKAIPVLSSCLDTIPDGDEKLAAIQALGTIATHSQPPSLFTQFLTLLDSENLKVQTEAVKGLGHLGDRRAIQPLEELNLKAWTNPSTSPDMQALREMLSWSLWQLEPTAHTGG